MSFDRPSPMIRRPVAAAPPGGAFDWSFNFRTTESNYTEGPGATWATGNNNGPAAAFYYGADGSQTIKDNIGDQTCRAGWVDLGGGNLSGDGSRSRTDMRLGGYTWRNSGLSASTWRIDVPPGNFLLTFAMGGDDQLESQRMELYDGVLDGSLITSWSYLYTGVDEWLGADGVNYAGEAAWAAAADDGTSEIQLSLSTYLLFAFMRPNTGTFATLAHIRVRNV